MARAGDLRVTSVPVEGHVRSGRLHRARRAAAVVAASGLGLVGLVGTGIARASTPAPIPIVKSGPYTLVTEPEDGMHIVDAFIAGAHRGEDLDMTMYELGDSEIEKLLVADVHHGVAVKVLLDRAYTGGQFNRAAFTWLQRRGVAVRWASARYDTTHEKSIVVGGVALIATFNLTPQYYGSSRDFGIFDSNPADVASITSTFNADWAGTRSAPSRGADLVWSPGSASALVSIIDNAQHTLLIENEEMADGRIETALEAAARRGVDVDVTMTASNAWASEFTALAAAGVHVRTYAANAPLYIHAKVIVADAGSSNETMFVGSENFGAGSLNWNRELGLVIGAGQAPLIAVVSSVMTLDFAGATPWH
jgi:phosphatidylserine/phosphatidylglycerophosphate/cardiolipin synthase-like enzyme